MATIQINTWIFWLIVIGVAVGIILVFYMITNYIGIRRCIDGFICHLADVDKRCQQRLIDRMKSPSAKLVKEVTWFVVVSVIAIAGICYVCGLLNMSSFIGGFIDVVQQKFTNKYPLLTTIIGAYLALLGHYMFLYPKVYVSPDVSFYVDCDNKKRLSWFVENRSLFDCIDIHIDAYACKYMHNEDDLQTYRINLKRSDYTVLSGRNSASNDRSVCVSTYNLPTELYDTKKKTYNFDYIVLYVKFTHALSHVTKIITSQYRKSDIYKGEFHGGRSVRLGAFQNPRTTINTIKAVMHKKFMYARKFETMSLIGIMILTLLCMIWPEICIVRLGIAPVLFVALSFTLLWFGFARLFYQLPILIKEEEDENKQYHANIDEEFMPSMADNALNCPYLAKQSNICNTPKKKPKMG